MLPYALFLLTTIFPLTLILLVTMQQSKKRTKNNQPNLPPGPSKLPIIGNLHQVLDADGLLHRSLARLSSVHGPIMYLLLGQVPTVVVSSQALARELFTVPGMDLNVSERPKAVAIHAITYGSSNVGAAPYGEVWRRLRKVCVVGLLSNRKVEGFRRAREEQVAQMMNSLHRQCTKADVTATATSGSGGGVVVDLGMIVKSLTSSIILRLVLGRTYRPSDAEKDSDLNSICHERSFFTLSLHLIDQVQAMLASFFFEDYFPAWGLGWLADAAFGSRRRLRRLCDQLDAVYEEILQRHEETAVGSGKGGEKEDFVDAVVAEQDYNSGVTRRHVKAVIADMLLGGTETSAVAISWAMAELVRNPEAMKRAQCEVRHVVGAGAGGNIAKVRSRLLVSESNLPHLPYLKAVVKETLRLHPVAPLLIPRETRATCCLGGYSIPAGARIYVNAWAIARDTASWEETEKFRPERFAGSDADYSDARAAARDDFRFLPFGAGRRACPGGRSASLVIELALANLICSFDWELPEGVDALDMAEAPGIAVGMRSGLVLKVRGYLRA